MYPVETAKVRLQSGKSAVPGPDEGGAGALYTGLGYGVGKECPNAAIYIATYGFLKPRFLALPFLDPSSGAAIFAALAAAGALGDAAGSVVRVPLELLNKQLQTGASASVKEAFAKLSASNLPYVLALSWAAVLARDMPFGALQLAFFDLYKNGLGFLDTMGVNIFVQRLAWGGAAGGSAAFLTTPFDVLTTRVMLGGAKAGEDGGTLPITSRFKQEAGQVLREGGPAGFWVGALERTVFFCPAACIFFASYDTFLELIQTTRAAG